MDPKSVVTHNEKLEDRVGNRRQYDVVIRGEFGGRPVLGVIECKDHSRKKGPAAIEAFAKKTENLGANLRLIVSRKGFTDQALKLASHENVGCLSLLPADPKQAGFSIGDMWYGLIKRWVDAKLVVQFESTSLRVAGFDSMSLKYDGKPVLNWFMRELLTTHAEQEEGEFALKVTFDSPVTMELNSQEHSVLSVGCIANRVHRKKRKWVSWSGDAFYDWHEGRFTLPPNGTLAGSAVETDLSAWQDYEGEIIGPSANGGSGFIRAVIYNVQKWDPARDAEVPELRKL